MAGEDFNLVDGTLRLAAADELPSPLPEGTRRVCLVHPMVSDSPPEALLTTLIERRDSLREKEIDARLEVVLDSENWIHLLTWTRAANQRDLAVGVSLRPAGESRSLAGLEGEVLAVVRHCLRRWSKDPDVEWQEAKALEGKLRDWHADAIERLRSDTPLGLPTLDHPLLATDETALAFLEQLLRAFQSPRMSRWLRELLAEPDWAARAKDSRALRFFGYWAVVSLQHRDLLPRLHEAFGHRRTGLAFHREDRAATRNGPLENWYDGWASDLCLDHLEQERQPYVNEAAPSPPARQRKPQVTIVIPSYQHAEFIERTVHSALNQSFPDVKVLVVDDGSTDQTVALAREIENARLEVRVNPENIGLGESFARAIEKVDTPYVAMLNSDDLFHSERIERCVEALRASAKTQVVATDYALIDGEDRRLSTADSCSIFDGQKVCEWLDWHDSRGDVSGEDPLADLLEGNFLLTSSNLVARTKFLRRHQPLWQRQEFCLDWQIFLAAAQEKGLHYLRQELMAYRLHATNTVWFDADREWRYYLESHQVVARVLREELKDLTEASQTRLLELLTGAVRRNSSLDGMGLLIAKLMDKVGADSRKLTPEAEATTRVLSAAAAEQRSAMQFSSNVGDRKAEVLRLLREVDFLRQSRNREEFAAERNAELESMLYSAVKHGENTGRLWRQAESERDRETEEKTRAFDQLARNTEDLERALTREREVCAKERAAWEEVRKVSAKEQTAWQTVREVSDKEQAAYAKEQEAWKKEGEAREAHAAERSARKRAEEQTQRTQGSLDEVSVQLSTTEGELSSARDDSANLSRRLDQRTWERDTLVVSGEYRFGDLILNKLKTRPLLRLLERAWVGLRHRWSLWRHAVERRFGGGTRVLSTACWNFPIYSQTFVYQEQTALSQKGYRIRFSYSKLDPRDYLPDAFAVVWKSSRPLILDRTLNQSDYESYQRRMPQKIDRLVSMICEETGLEEAFVRSHDNFLQAFSYTRHVEAWAPRYLHSYFFYDRSLMSLVAGFLLDLPRGVSCYADHLMEDYEFKLVPLHLKLCDIVIATSARIKGELCELQPEADPDKILVKPNAIDSEKFAPMERPDPPEGEPFRIVCINRIEPKKGLTYLAEAVRRLNEKGLRVEMHQVGEADEGIQSSLDYRDTLHAQLETDQLWGTVHLEGRQNADGVRRFLGIAHLYLAPFVEVDTGDKDGIPTSLLEAMATGIPTVATDAGSIKEVIDDGVDGVVVPQMDAQALADAIESLLLDPERRAALGRAATEKVRTQFDIRVCERVFHEKLEQVLADHGGS